ncbi:MAG: hypothetical protein COT14_02050 [Candidatus Diapherotrites archaeon CG08_land_8_20_14_0_20_30_16]|nr:MAG: hypothetical protein COT14_02050 [Candidatus Diapherotrites archaeon CG08_land_8_20_14_0_20_30_16]
MVGVYEVVIEKETETGQYYATVPLLPGCYSYADTLEGLVENMKEAISLHLEVLKEKNEFISNNEVFGLVKVSV